MKPKQHLCALAIVAAGTFDAGAQSTPETPPDKSGYTLFHPTPKNLMREMSTDRPDQTESAYTVDAGHFQIEMDVVGAVFDHSQAGGGDVHTTLWGTSLNFKMGLLNNVDMQFVTDPYVHVEVEDHLAQTVDTASGVGELQTRVKINLWGNDGGKTAFAVMPFVKWPLPESRLRTGRAAGGVILLLAYELPSGWASTVMSEVDLFVRDGAGGSQTLFVNSITFSHGMKGKLGGYMELFTVVGGASNTTFGAQADVGLTYAWNDDTQLDVGCNFGVTENVPDFNPFIGLSVRF